ncbi:MAG: TetR/AcrR family transcriptional regulator [Oscillospiraceae bacterium]|nr:TetR/AcrR family transcriptional regulator [Oscillospiraceae bacterium]
MRKPAADVEDLRGEIIQTALTIFARAGYDAANMQQIADALSITRTPLYYHFENKQVLYGQAIQSYLSFKRDKYTQIAAADQGFFEEMREHLLFSCHHFPERVLLSALDRQEFARLRDLNQETLLYIKALKERSVARALARGELRADTDQALLIHNIYVSCYGLMRLCEDTINDLTEPQKEQLVTQLILQLRSAYGAS